MGTARRGGSSVDASRSASAPRPLAVRPRLRGTASGAPPRRASAAGSGRRCAARAAPRPWSARPSGTAPGRSWCPRTRRTRDSAPWAGGRCRSPRRPVCHYIHPSHPPRVVVVRHAQQRVHQRAQHRLVPRVPPVRPQQLRRPRQVPQLPSRRRHIAVLAGVAVFIRAEVPTRSWLQRFPHHSLARQRAALVLVFRRNRAADLRQVLLQQAQQ